MFDKIIKKAELVGQLKEIAKLAEYCRERMNAEVSSPEGSQTAIIVIEGVFERLVQEYQRITDEWERTRHGTLKE